MTCGKIIVDIAVSAMIPSLSGQRKLAGRAILLLMGRRVRRNGCEMCVYRVAIVG